MRISRNLPVPPPQPAAPSAEVLALRTSWKWAYLSHFLFTYNPMLHLEDIELFELEDDLADGTFEVIPTVMQRLLTSLTPHDKRMILENWQQQLRKQSIKRAGDHNLLGTEDDPVEFSSLIMSDKLEIFQSLCEWQFHNPNNLRARMKEDDDYATWRIEPIAYDSKGNAYWLMGGNRLWIQHAPPPKRAARSHKRKQPAATTVNGRKSAKRGSAVTPASSKAVGAAAKLQNKSAAIPTLTGRPMRGTRTRPAAAGSSSSQKPRTVGTRVSTRLRGREEEEVWQPIPEEWLKEESGEDTPEIPPQPQPSNGKGKGKEVEFKKETTLKALDDVSELTSLSDLSDIEENKEDEEEEEESTPTPAPDFSSSSEERWETVCATLPEWEAFPERFEKSMHRGETAFYKLLTNDIVPMITEVLRTDVRKKHMEEAVVHRKRSSRIAVKESVKEAERAEARRKAEEEKELERHKRWEARARKEEEDRARRETARSARLRERGGARSESMDVDVVGGAPENKPTTTNGTALDAPVPAVTPVKFVINAAKSGTQTPKEDEPWELHCEICHKRGMNLDEGQELMCCERCNKWQHIRCHDQADFVAGRPRRNWEVVDFLCTACAARDRAVSQSSSSQQQQPQSYGYPSHTSPWMQYNGSTPTNGVISAQHHQSPPDHRTAVPVKSAFKQQSTYDAPIYSNGRANYALPQTQAPQSYAGPATAQTQYNPRHAPAATTANAGYSLSGPSLAHTPAAAPYTSTPNMYLSNYVASYRQPHSPHNPSVQPQQPQSSVSHYPTARGQAPMASSHTGGWPQQQQAQYSQLTGQQAWNGASHGSGSPYARSSVPPQAFEQPQQNGYYHSHPTAPSNSLAQPPHLACAPQPYYTGGPTSQP